jgi:hypothetical protein
VDGGVWWFRGDLVFANSGAQPKKDVPTHPFRHLSPRGWPQRLLEDTTNLERFLFIFQVTLLKPYLRGCTKKPVDFLWNNNEKFFVYTMINLYKNETYSLNQILR